MKLLKITLIAMLVSLIAGSGAVAAFYFFDFEEKQTEEIAEVFAETTEIIIPPEEEAEIYIEEAGEDIEEEPEEETEEEPEEFVCPYTVTVLVSAAGDTTLGGDRRWAGYGSFLREFDENGAEHFFANVAHIFYESDLAIVNLEGTLTDIVAPHMDKDFVFRGPVHFTEILTAGNINVVSIANNHTQDFFIRGYDDTRDALAEAGIVYFGNEFVQIIEINGISVGLFGHRIWADSRENRNRITDAIKFLQEQGAQLIIAYNHWGEEQENFPESYQRSIGKFTIDQGAHLVLGAHPHVLQGIEEYNGGYIVYSLANFCFGGNAAPSDQDTFIFQQEFTFYRGELIETQINIIPARVSSVRGRNNFQPTPAEGEDADRIMARIERYSRFDSGGG
jgi:poly-gamma-glutamate synthesis protein (capsule biosynthesis protein)